MAKSMSKLIPIKVSPQTTEDDSYDDILSSAPAIHGSNPHDSQVAKLNSLHRFLRDTQYAPDLEGIEVIASWYVNHWLQQEKTIWIMVLGPSGMGKSTLAIEPICGLPRVERCSVINEHTFLSGFDDVGVLQKFDAKYGKGGETMATRKSHGLIAFSDFSTILNADDKVVKMIFGIFRELYEGYCGKNVGNKGKLEWHGKCSIIAACTNVIEEYWALAKDLGERWVTLRWRYGNRNRYMDYAHLHRENENKITKEYHSRFASLLQTDNFQNVITQNRRNAEYEKLKELQEVARFTCRVRRSIKRVAKGYRNTIIGAGEEEGPNRFYKCMINLAIAHAILLRKPEIDEYDIRIGARIAIDTIPLQRRQILGYLSRHYEALARHDNSIPVSQIASTLRMNANNCKYICEELDELGIIKLHSADTMASLNAKDGDEIEEDNVVLNAIIVTPIIREYLSTMPIRILDTGATNDLDLSTEDD